MNEEQTTLPDASKTSFSYRGLLSQPDAVPAQPNTDKEIASPEPGADDHREIVSHDNSHQSEIAQFIAANEHLTDPTMRRDYFAHFDETDFIELLQQNAALVRTGDAANLQHFDGQIVALNGVEVPDLREKEELLRETWRTARTFLLKNDIPDQDALDYAALTVAGGTLYVHPFADGNGRASRVTSYEIARGKSDPSEIQGILQHTGSEAWKIAPLRILASPQTEFGGNQPETIKWAGEDDFAGDGEDGLGGIIANSFVFQDRIVRRFIETQGEAAKQSLAGNLHQDNDGSTLSAEQFIYELVNEPEAGISNTSALLELHREARADFVHRFLEAMQSDTPIEPNRRIKALTNPDDTRASGWVEPEEAQRMIDERAVNGLLKPRDQQLIMHRAESGLVNRRKISHQQ